MASPQQPALELPSGALYDIVSYVVADYLDSVTLGSLRLRSLDISSYVEIETKHQNAPNSQCTMQDHSVPMLAEVVKEDPAQHVPNPMIPFFSMSSRTREIVLNVLSRALGVSLTEMGGRLTRLIIKPWNALLSMRLICSNRPFVQIDIGSLSESISFHRVYAHIGAMANAMDFMALPCRWNSFYSQLDFNQLKRHIDFIPKLSVMVHGVYMLSICDGLSHAAFYERATFRLWEMLSSKTYAVTIHRHAIKFVRWGQDLIENLARQRPIPLEKIDKVIRDFLLLALQKLQPDERLEFARAVPHISEGVLEVLDEADINFASDTLSKICNYQTRPNHVTQYNKCQEIAYDIYDKIQRHREQASSREETEVTTSQSS